MVHFIMEAVSLLDLSVAQVNNVRGSGSAQYPPSMMLGLLIYCYASCTFSSRKIERLTHENVAVRLLCGDTHPDHDSICKFRRENRALVESSFHQVLECAARGRGGAGQYNFTDPESLIMKAGSGEHFEQSYNAQAVVEVHSRLVVGQMVSDASNDEERLEPTLAAQSPVLGSVSAVLVDSGYY